MLPTVWSSKYKCFNQLRANDELLADSENNQVHLHVPVTSFRFPLVQSSSASSFNWFPPSNLSIIKFICSQGISDY